VIRTVNGETGESNKPLLRVGLLLDSPGLKNFEAEIVRQIQAGSFARLELIIHDLATAWPVSGAPGLPARPRRWPFLFSPYARWDARRGDPRSNPLSPADDSELLNAIPSVVLGRTVDGAGGSQPDVIADIRAMNLDVILCPRGHRLRGEILRVARRGAWSLQAGDNDYFQAQPPFFWEAYERSPVSALGLHVLADDPRCDRVLARGFYSTRHESWMLNCRQPYWSSVNFVVQKLRELHEFGWEHVDQVARPASEYRPKRTYTIPTNRQIGLWWGHQLFRQKTRRFETPMVRHWRIATRVVSTAPLTKGDPAGLAGFRFHESPKGHYFADPFLIKDAEKHWLFFEDYSYATRHGVIGCAEVLPDGSLDESRTILQRPYHLSYPCLLRDGGGELYMIPETLQNGTIELYRCLRFPDRWTLEKVLLHCRAVDSTIFKRDGVFWLLTSILEPFANGRQLCLMYARDLFGEWISHPANPISMDIRNNRGAGAIVSRDGMLIRPSQDCSRSYGYSFSLNEIIKLNPTEYEERPILTVEPTWAPALTGTHTYAVCGEVEAIDGAVRMPRSVVAPTL